MAQSCVVNACGRPTPGYLCRDCVGRLIDALESLARGPRVKGRYEPGLAEDLVDVMARLMRSGLTTGVGSRSAGTPLPYHEAASDLLWTLRNTLWAWCSDVYARLSRPDRLGTTGPEMALWLRGHILAAVRHPDAARMYDEIMWVTGAVHDMVDIAPIRLYLGQCGAVSEGHPCRETLYTLPTHHTVRCRRCAAVYDVGVRRGQMLDHAQDQLAPAVDISRALSTLCMPVRVERIRKWAERGRLQPYDPHPFDPHKRARYRLGDVVSLLLASPRSPV